MKRIFKVCSCVLGLLLIIAACHSAFIERDYARACFDLLVSILVYPEGWVRNTVGKSGSESK